jgi:ABC-type antimicrobial peptide transport system permease subunit
LLEARPAQIDALAHSLTNDRRLNLFVQPEYQYYESQMASAIPVQFMGTLAALIMAAGSAFGGMNTMYAAVARRSSEIGVLRVLGFSRKSVLISFLFESVFISLLGGATGCLFTLPLNSIETTIGSFSTWSQLSFHFHVTPAILLSGLFFAALIGAVGGFLPAHNAASKQIVDSLRMR